MTIKSSKKSRWLRQDVLLKGLELSATPRSTERINLGKGGLAGGNELPETAMIYLQGEFSIPPFLHSG